MKVSVDPTALQAAAGPLVTLAYDVGMVPHGLSGDVAACAVACGDAGLAEGVHAFSTRIGGGVGDLGRAVDLLGQVLVAVADAYLKIDARAMPSGSGG
jgi:hypothetical protein